MQARSCERVGPAAAVLRFSEWPTPDPLAGEVRVRVPWSGVNPADVKSRAGLRRRTLPFERIIPHSDGSGVIDAVDAVRAHEAVEAGSLVGNLVLRVGD